MTSRDFAYWLQGFFEITKADRDAPLHLTVDQRATVIKHLDLVKTTEENSFFISMVEMNLDDKNLPRVISAYFKHVLDPAENKEVGPAIAQKLDQFHLSPKARC